ncbi:MAG: NUDIX domain-containing protein [Bacilli bacterium]|nr:NUDIX domain-containing protein [Bacilli bacterium]
MSVRTIIFDETRTKVLLVQERSDLGYSLPGGWTELTLSPSESAKKEVREEVGAECEIVRLVGVTDRYKDIETTGVPEYVLTFEGRLVSEIGESCHEIVSKGFFDIDNLPPFSCKNVENQMKKLIYAARDNKTIFD